MNPIMMRLLGKVTCKTCNDTKRIQRPWKRNSSYELVDVPCPDCCPPKRDVPAVTISCTPKDGK